MPDLATRLLAMRACPDAVQWARGYTDDAAAWRECQRGDWMLWLLVWLNVDRKRLVLAACECARLSLHLVRDGEERPRIAIETAEAWARYEGPTLDNVHRAAVANAAASAASAANAASAAVANAAASAASAAANAASAAYAAANAANAAYAAANAANAAANVANVAYAVANVAYAAANVANVAYAVANVAYAVANAAANAANAAYAEDAYAASLSQCADIVRWHFPEVPNVQ